MSSTASAPARSGAEPQVHGKQHGDEAIAKVAQGPGCPTVVDRGAQSARPERPGRQQVTSLHLLVVMR